MKTVTYDYINDKYVFHFGLDPCVKSYKVFDNKTVVVTFEDGSIERSICDDEDTFSLEMGLSICILKHFCCGSSGYNKMIKSIIRRQEDFDKAEEKKKEEEKNRRLARERAKAKKARKRKEKQIEIFKEALIRANKEIAREKSDDKN